MVSTMYAAVLQCLIVVFLSFPASHSVRTRNDDAMGSRASARATVATGSIEGVVTFSGANPKKQSMTGGPDGACGREHALDRLVLGQKNAVKYTLVFLKNPPAASTFGMKQAAITQSSCRFTPHMVIAARGSSIEFINQDPVLHNCHGYYFAYNAGRVERTTAFNIAQPNQGQHTMQDLRKQGMISVECDAGHTWMSAWIWVSANPYATVTDDRGAFRFDGLPAGTYTVVMWHEGWEVTQTGVDGRPVFSDPVVEERQIVVGEGGSGHCDFQLH